MTTLSPNFTIGWPKNIKGVVIHYTDSGSAQSSIDHFKNPNNKVSSHIIIDKDGIIYPIVDIKNRAWHAGQSSWGGISNCNSFMLGIELVNYGLLTMNNGKLEDSYHQIFTGQAKQEGSFYWEIFPEKQIKSLIKILQDWQKQFLISGTWIVGHNHIAPRRKIDPGLIFPWEKLDFLSYNQYGTLNDNVKALQSFLYTYDELKSDIDGVIGPLTLSALNDANKKYDLGLKIDTDWLIDKNYIAAFSNKIRKQIQLDII